MSDDNKTPNPPGGDGGSGGGQAPSGTQVGGGQASPNGDTQPSDISALPEWAQKIINDSRAEAAKYRVEKNELAEQQRKAEEDRKRKQLEAEGKYQEILSELTPKVERMTVLEQVVQLQLEAELKNVPDNHKWLFEEGTVDQRLARLLKAKDSGLFNVPSAPDMNPGSRGRSGDGGGVTVTEADRQAAALAKQSGYNIKPEDIAKRRGRNLNQKIEDDEK